MATTETETEETTANQDPAVMGTLEADEMAQLNALRRAGQDYTYKIGQLTVQQHRLMQMLGQTEARAQVVLDAAAKRMAIPEGQAWVAGPDGKVRLATPEGEAQ